MPDVIVNSNNRIFAGAGTLTQVEHDNNLSGLGTLASPLGINSAVDIHDEYGRDYGFNLQGSYAYNMSHSAWYTPSAARVTNTTGTAVMSPDDVYVSKGGKTYSLTAMKEYSGVTHDSNLSGLGTPSSPLGLDSSVSITRSDWSRTARLDAARLHMFEGTNTAWYYAGFASLEDTNASADLYAGYLRLADDEHTAFRYVTPASIDKWNNPTTGLSGATSGLQFAGSTGWNAHCIFLNEKGVDDTPYKLTVPASSVTDINYYGIVAAGWSPAPVNLIFGIKTAATTAANFVDSSMIAFPYTLDYYQWTNYNCQLRYTNNTNSPVDLYFGLKTDVYGTFPSANYSTYSISDDNIKARSFAL